MKSKLFSKARLLIVSAILLSFSLVTGFAEGPTMSGCPEASGGYASKGIRTKKVCTENVTEAGYWWYIDGEIKWVGTIIAGAGGRYEASVRTTTYLGQEYTCIGFDNICWVCNCYYQPVATVED